MGETYYGGGGYGYNNGFNHHGFNNGYGGGLEIR